MNARLFILHLSLRMPDKAYLGGARRATPESFEVHFADAPLHRT